MDTSSMQPTESGRNRQPKIVEGRPRRFYLSLGIGILFGAIPLVFMFRFLLFPVITDLLGTEHHSHWLWVAGICDLVSGLLAIYFWFGKRALLLNPYSGSLIAVPAFFRSQKGSSVSAQVPQQSGDSRTVTLPAKDREIANAITETYGQTPVDQRNTDLLPVQEPKTELGVPEQNLNTGQGPPLQDEKTPEIDGNDPDKTQDFPTQKPPSMPVVANSNTSSPEKQLVTDIIRMRTFAVPRDGMNLELSADKWAFDQSRTCYALADGVSTSFLPGYWAKIVTEQFVKYSALPSSHLSKDDIESWLRTSSQEWERWVKEEWVPQAIEASGQTNWDREISRGASTTFVGCSFSLDHLRQHGKTDIYVTAVGDAVFFLVSTNSQYPDRWTHSSYRLTSAEDFGPATETLASPERRIARDCERVYQETFSVTCSPNSSHIIVLATDALAQWIMRMTEKDVDPWQELFGLLDDAAFKQFVDRYRRIGAMEIDDTTMMIIELSQVRATVS